MPVVTADPRTVALVFHALSDPTRLEIVDRLRSGERCVCELMDLLDAAQSRLSFHLRVLKDCGLVSDRRDGRWVYYTLHREALLHAEHYLERLRKAAQKAPGSAACCT